MRRLVAPGLAAALLLGACTVSSDGRRPAPTIGSPPVSDGTSASVAPSPSTTPPSERDRARAGRALLAAAATGDVAAARAALRAGARVEVRNRLRQTPLLVAATHDRVGVARLLVRLGADPDALDFRHDTPWLVTGVTGSVAMLDTLLPANPDLTIRNRFGGLSPIPAAERGHVDYLRRVVRTDVDLDHVNDSGWTALLEAVILGDGGPRHQRVVRILVDAGVDTSIADRDGVTALQHARARGYDRIAATLATR